MVIKKIITDREGQRLDNYLFKIYQATPNSHVYRLIRKGRVRINGKTCKDNTYKLQYQDELTIPNPINPKKPIPSEETINIVKSMIISENDDFWVLNKKANFCVHSSKRDTFGIIEVMQHMYDEAHLVHRLDRNTTGCLLIAKSYPALTELQNLWKQGKVKKRYKLLSHGKWKYPKTQTVDKPLLRLTDQEQRVIISDKGKSAITHFTLIKQYPDYVLLEALIETGRTHQIRVHAKSINHPILGDKRYHDAKDALTEYIFLHANNLEFQWKDQNISINCSLPKDKQAIIDSL